MLNSQLIKGLMIDWEKIDHGSYLWDIIAISGVDQISFDHAVTFFVGENGSGKSTFDDGPIHPCAYEETDSYQVTSMFINNREQILRRLLDE